ncbi:DMT family transporter [uncultured Pelagimonas sp.]|uniref:DMT family transporter n=1 Tax=uncultured Pelagimonas sp. TaxID=1618102 RepID=UPI00260392B6|nr:DMT family transporter [uncultured Pelagimonas sp.]
MELWITITIAAAFLQNLRSTLQKHLKGVMGTTGATFVRFGFGLPFAALYWSVLIWGFGFEPPDLSAKFALWVIIGALAQIAATFLLVHLFSLRNFAVGNAYSRTEPMQTAIFAFVLFGTEFSAGAIIAICIAVMGVMLISVAQTKITPRNLLVSVTSPTALIGIGAGTLFGLAAIGFQTAARSVGSDVFVVQAAATLLIGISFQTAVMLLYMLLKDPGELVKIRRAWKPAFAVGFVGATATFGWFAAFTLQQAALVKVVAQIEMLFSFGSSIFVFKETPNRTETIGCLFIVASIICLLLWA